MPRRQPITVTVGKVFHLHNPPARVLRQRQHGVRLALSDPDGFRLQIKKAACFATNNRQ